MKKSKKVVVNRRKGVDRRKKLRASKDRRIRQQSDEVEYIDYPATTRAQQTRPNDFDESEGEQIIVEHPIEKFMLTITKDIDYASKIRKDNACLAY